MIDQERPLQAGPRTAKKDRAMRAVGWAAERLLKLPPAASRQVVVERDLQIPLDDGVFLLADHWAPVDADGRPAHEAPIAVVRTPYGRGGLLGWLYSRVLAERGMQVLIVSTRGTFGSGGPFRAMHHEREDGMATLRWLAGQPWARGGWVLTGSSYFGYTGWAMAAGAPEQVKALVPHETSSRGALGMMPPGQLSLETLLGFSVNTATQEQGGSVVKAMLGIGRNRVEEAMRTLPIAEADAAALGRKWGFFQETLLHDQNDPYWRNEDFSSTVGEVTVPVSSVAGWHDIFIADQLRDYEALVEAGRPARLMVGPWWHTHLGGFAATIAETTGWGASLARGAAIEDRAPVRLFVMGVDEWRDFQEWPPAGYAQQRWHLAGGGALGQTSGPSAAPTKFVYDPADPTPSLGGAKLEGRGGPVDNRSVEKRSDVLTFTSDDLEADLEIIGEIAAQVWLRTDRPTCDLFVRLCDVDKRGRSWNVCDGLVNVRPDGITQVDLNLSPTAYVFRQGHRIRVQVSAGSFPRFARNLGGDEPIATATEMHTTTAEIFHDATHPSALLLPAR